MPANSQMSHLSLVASQDSRPIVLGVRRRGVAVLYSGYYYWTVLLASMVMVPLQMVALHTRYCRTWYSRLESTLQGSSIQYQEVNLFGKFDPRNQGTSTVANGIPRLHHMDTGRS